MWGGHSWSAKILRCRLPSREEVYPCRIAWLKWRLWPWSAAHQTADGTPDSFEKEGNRPAMGRPPRVASLAPGNNKTLWLSHDHVRDRLPPGRIVPPHVHREALADEQQWQGVEVYLVHAPVDHQVARHAENDQQVQARIEEIIVEDVGEAADGRVHEPAGCDEDQPAVQLW